MKEAAHLGWKAGKLESGRVRAQQQPTNKPRSQPRKQQQQGKWQTAQTSKLVGAQAELLLCPSEEIEIGCCCCWLVVVQGKDIFMRTMRTPLPGHGSGSGGSSSPVSSGV